MFIPDACYTSYGSFRFADHPAGKAISLGETPEGKTVRSIALWRTRVGCVRGFTCADSGIGFGYVSRADASGSPVAALFIVIWFDHTQPSPSLPMASTGHPSMASLQSASSSGVVGCL